MFLDVVNKNHSYTSVVVLRPPGPPHHLEDVRDWVVDVALRLPVEILGSLDDHQVGGEIDSPGQRTCGNKDLLVEETGQDDDLDPLLIRTPR